MESKLVSRRRRAIESGPTQYGVLTVVPPPTMDHPYEWFEAIGQEAIGQETWQIPLRNGAIQPTHSSTLTRDNPSSNPALRPPFVERTCCICMDIQPSVAVFGCGHVVFCTLCTTKFKDKASVQRCPLCDGAVLDIDGRVQFVTLH